MLKELFINAMENFDTECLFVESSLGNFIIEDFFIKIEENFVTIEGSEYDKCTEEQNGLLRGLKIDLNKITDFEDYSGNGENFIAVGINNGEHYAEFSN